MATRQELETQLARIPSNSKLSRMGAHELFVLRKDLGVGVGDAGTTKAGQIRSLEGLRMDLERRIGWHKECETLVAAVAAELGMDPVKLHAWATTNGLNPLRSMRTKAREVAAWRAELQG